MNFARKQKLKDTVWKEQINYCDCPGSNAELHHNQKMHEKRKWHNRLNPWFRRVVIQYLNVLPVASETAVWVGLWMGLLPRFGMDHLLGQRWPIFSAKERENISQFYRRLMTGFGPVKFPIMCCFMKKSSWESSTSKLRQQQSTRPSSPAARGW